jgi:hypothetical protein
MTLVKRLLVRLGVAEDPGVLRVGLGRASRQRLANIESMVGAGTDDVIIDALRVYEVLCERILAGDRLELVSPAGERQELEIVAPTPPEMSIGERP